MQSVQHLNAHVIGERDWLSYGLGLCDAVQSTPVVDRAPAVLPAAPED